MRRIAAIMLTVMGLALVAVPAALAGQETRVYDAKGRYQGRATTNTANPRQQNLYDAKGHYLGRVMTDSNGNARLYDQHGKYQGRATGWRNGQSSK